MVLARSKRASAPLLQPQCRRPSGSSVNLQGLRRHSSAAGEDRTPGDGALSESRRLAIEQRLRLNHAYRMRRTRWVFLGIWFPLVPGGSQWAKWANPGAGPTTPLSCMMTARSGPHWGALTKVDVAGGLATPRRRPNASSVAMAPHRRRPQGTNPTPNKPRRPPGPGASAAMRAAEAGRRPCAKPGCRPRRPLSSRIRPTHGRRSVVVPFDDGATWYCHPSFRNGPKSAAVGGSKTPSRLRRAFMRNGDSGDSQGLGGIGGAHRAWQPCRRRGP